MVLARVAVIALLVLASARRTAADEATIRLLNIWIAAVQAHVPGEVDPPLASISTLNREDLLRLRPFAQALVGLVPDPRRVRVSRIQLSDADTAIVRMIASTALAGRSANDFVKRAALLHTDVVLLVHSYPTLHPAIQPRPRQPRREGQGQPLEVPLVIARGPDGRYDGLELGNLNWDYARDLLDAVTPLPASDETVRRWYRSIGANFASSYSFGEAWPHFQRAGKLLPDDAGVLFGIAAIQETLASPRIQDYVRVTRLPGHQRFMWVTAAREHLDRAERLLASVIRFDPAFVEARLRLGRVIDQLGRHDAAIVEFTEVIEARPDRALAFYAHLFRGDAERALLRDDAARHSYQQALDLFPRAQSARIALGHLARQRSDQDAVAQVEGARLEQLQRATRALAGALEKRDQSVLLTFSQVVALRCPMSANVECVRSSLDSAIPDGQTSLVDATFAGIVVGESDVGRSLLMVFSDGMDTASYMPSTLVLDAARRSDVVAYAVATGSEMPEFLEELTNLTGGRVFKTDKASDLTPIFRAILDEFRYRYLITYTPAGVQKEGWHKLDVRVKRSGTRVRARPGYQGR